MHNHETTYKLLELQKRLMSVKDMMGWLCTGHRYSVKYENNPAATKDVQAQLDVAAEFIHVIYAWSILDEAGFKPTNKWLSSDTKLEFKAWVHIRHTGAHAPNGRADGYYKEFDDFMTSNVPGKSSLKQSCTWTADSIELPYAMSFRFFEFAENMVKEAIGYCANNNAPP